MRFIRRERCRTKESKAARLKRRVSLMALTIKAPGFADGAIMEIIALLALPCWPGLAILLGHWVIMEMMALSLRDPTGQSCLHDKAIMEMMITLVSY